MLEIDVGDAEGMEPAPTSSRYAVGLPWAHPHSWPARDRGANIDEPM